jgi:hypothetical protein
MLRSLVISVLMCSGCGSFFLMPDSLPSAIIAPSESLTSIEVLLSRASLTDVDFEHFSVAQGHLFKECGKIKRSVFYPLAQQLQVLPPQYRKSITERSERLLESLATASPSWQPAGKNRSLTDPGIARVTFRTARSSSTIETSLDAVRNGSQGHEKLLKRVVTMTRGAAGEMCGNKVFYGIGF